MNQFSPIDIWVSHTSSEHELVENWRQSLKSNDDPVHLLGYASGDVDNKLWDRRAGESILDVATQISDAPFRLLVLSKRYMDQPWCLIELFLVLTHKRSLPTALYLSTEKSNEEWSDSFIKDPCVIVPQLIEVGEEFRDESIKLEPYRFDDIDETYLCKRLTELIDERVRVVDAESIRSFIRSFAVEKSHTAYVDWLETQIKLWAQTETGRKIVEANSQADASRWITDCLTVELGQWLADFHDFLDVNPSLHNDPSDRRQLRELLGICALRWVCPRWSALHWQAYTTGVPLVITIVPPDAASVSLLELQARLNTAAVSQSIPVLQVHTERSSLTTAGSQKVDNAIHIGDIGDDESDSDSLVVLLEGLWKELLRVPSPSKDSRDPKNRRASWGDLNAPDSNAYIQQLQAALQRNRRSRRRRHIAFELSDSPSQAGSQWRAYVQKLNELLGDTPFDVFMVRQRDSGDSTLHMVPCENHYSIQQPLQDLVMLLED